MADADNHCRIVVGDLDYVVNPAVIRRDFSLSWGEREQRMNALSDYARSSGAGWVSLYARGSDLSEQESLQRLVSFGAERPDLRWLLHFFDDASLAAALSARPGFRPLLNYVSGEKFKLRRMLPVLARFRCPVVVQPIADGGIPCTARERVAVAAEVVQELLDVGLTRADIYVDALSPALGALPCGLGVSLDTLAGVKRELGVRTVVWPHNVGLGQPRPAELTAAYIGMAIQAGLDLAVVDTASDLVTRAISLANSLRASGGKS